MAFKNRKTVRDKKKHLYHLGYCTIISFKRLLFLVDFLVGHGKCWRFFLSGLDPTRYIGLKKKKSQIGELLLGLTREMVRWGACQLGVGPQKQ